MGDAFGRSGLSGPGPGSGAGARLFRPEMLMIGAVGRDTGKTELACRVIRSHAAHAPIAALKVTTVVRTDGGCPRGGAGCGVCSSLLDPWCVIRELDADSGKDTSRLLGSGAREAWWLRVREDSLRDGASGLLEHVPAGWVSVCESNSLSRVVEPGLFLQVRSASERLVKGSARAVADLVDRTVVSDGATFDLALERISLLDGQWALQRDACAVVIADPPPEERPRESEATTAPLVASLRIQFTQVETAAPAGADDGRRLLRAVAEALPRSNYDWCLVASARGSSIPAGLVNAMFRRREGVDAVVERGSSRDPASLVGLFHRRLFPRVMAALDASVSRVPNLAALGSVRELVLASAST